MRLSGSQLMSSVRVVVILAALVVLAASGIAARQAPAQQAPAPAQPPADQMVFAAEHMLVAFTVAEGSAPDFEAVLAKVREVLAKSDKPERKQQAAHWKILKVDGAQAGEMTYFFLIDQVVKGATYDPFKILAEGLPPDEVRKLYEKISTGVKGIRTAPLAKIMDMGGGAS